MEIDKDMANSIGQMEKYIEANFPKEDGQKVQ